MKKIGIIVLSILFFASCSSDSDKKILIEGTTYISLNIRATADDDGDENILGNLDGKYERNVLPKERSQLENSISMLDRLDEEQGNIR